MTTESARRHVDAERQRFGSEHDLEQSGGEALLHGLSKGGNHAGVVRGPLRPRGRRSRGRSRGRAVRRRADPRCVRRSARGSPPARRRSSGVPRPRGHCLTASSQALRLKMNTMAGSMSPLGQCVDDLGPSRRGHPGLAQAPGRRARRATRWSRAAARGAIGRDRARGRDRPGGSPSRRWPHGRSASRAGASRRSPRWDRAPIAATRPADRRSTRWPRGRRAPRRPGPG